MFAIALMVQKFLQLKQQCGRVFAIALMVQKFGSHVSVVPQQFAIALMVQKKAKKPYLDAEAAAKKKANEVSEQYEVTKNEERIKTEVITRTVEKIVDRPIYLNVCFDADGVSAVNQAASIISTGKPKTGLP